MGMTELLKELRNYFIQNTYAGEFKVSGGNIAPSFNLQLEQYYMIEGSVFNDGVHKFGDNDLKDEEFTGAIWLLAIPQAVIDLCNDIDNYNATNEKAIQSPYTSESFGGYSYTLKSGASGGGSGATWQSVFSKRLNIWRKI